MKTPARKAPIAMPARDHQAALGQRQKPAPLPRPKALVQVRDGDDAPLIVHNVLQTPGETLAPTLRKSMEDRFHHDFSAVRVHTDDQAAQSARAFAADAYTVSPHVVFAPGRYAPHSKEGMHLLAHELTHVVQNARSGTLSASAASVSHPSDAAEREAERASREVVEGRSVRVGAAPAAAIQRLSTGVGVLLGVLGAGVLAGVGLGIAKAAGAFDKQSSDEPSLDDPVFRAKWDAALQEGFDRLEAKKQKECAFPQDREDKHVHDDANWQEAPTNRQRMLGGTGFRPRGGTPFEAVTNLFANLDQWSCDCRLFGEIFQLYAWHKALEDNPAAFNKRFANLNLNAEDTTGLDRQKIGAEMGGDVDPASWDSAPVGSKVVWRNDSDDAATPWSFEHAIKRSMGGGGEPARYAAQGVGYHATEAEVKKGIAEHAVDYPFVFEITDAVLAKLQQEGTSQDIIGSLTTMKGKRVKTWKAFVQEPPMRDLMRHRDNLKVVELLREQARNEPAGQEGTNYITTYIHREKVEIPK